MATKHGAEHSFSAGNVCERCGRTRLQVAKDGAPCAGGTASSQPPDIVVLARPLAIVAASGPDAPELGALLVSADDASKVAFGIRAPAARFDPDEAFRQLDSRRSWAETVYGWVAESLAAAQVSAPIGTDAEPAPWQAPPWLLPAAFALAAVVALHQLPLHAVLSSASAIYIGSVILLMIGMVAGAGAAGCLGAAMLFVFAFVLAFELGTKPWANRAFLDILAVAVVFCIPPVVRWVRSRLPSSASALSEHVLEAGEAVQYRAELCTVGTVAVLSVAIQCVAEDGRVLRQVLLPVNGARREHAEHAARMALAPDADHARKRRARETAEAERQIAEAEREVEREVQRELADEAARAARAEAAEAIDRLTELERVRRSLPE